MTLRPVRARARHIVLAAGGAFALVLATAVPAEAHHPELGGSSVCAVNGTHVITWEIGNSESGKTMTIVSATARRGSTSYPITGLPATIGPDGEVTGTTVLPGSLTGRVRLVVTGDWPSANPVSRTFDLDLPDPCTGTTTTTAPPATTTTTTAPPATTTTTEPSAATTTTAPSSTTTGPSGTSSTSPTTDSTTGSTIGTQVEGATTTTPSTTQGSGTPVSADPPVTPAGTPNGSLPRTGADAAWMLLGIGAVALGALTMAFAPRERMRSRRYRRAGDA